MSEEKESYAMDENASEAEKGEIRLKYGINSNRPKSPHTLQAPAVHLPREKLKRIDYILIYPNKSLDECEPASSTYKHLESQEKLRDVFETHLKEEGFDMQKDIIGENVFVKLHTPFPILCQEAQDSHIEMPLKGHQIYPEEKSTIWQRFKNKYLVTDTEVDFVSAPFQLERLHLYEGADDPEQFFRPAMRSFLTHHILINMDIRNEKEEQEDPFSKKGLQYMLMKKAYTDGFNLHDESSDDPAYLDDMAAYKAHMGSRFLIPEDEMVPQEKRLSPDDNRQVLSATWAKKWFKYQPLWKIRNYFGEKIALYFAWAGTLVQTLIIPTILGFAIFIYGLTLSVKEEYFTNTNSQNGTTVNITTTPKSIATEVADEITDLVGVLQKAFDNEATPYFGLIICLWGTIFLEVWKRKNYTLAYEWDVENFEDTEPDRPQFYGTKTAPNPVIPDELEWIYPIGRKIAKYAFSAFVLIFMVCLVLVCVAVVVLYRVYMTVWFCGKDSTSTIACLLVSTIAASILQAIFIMLLGRIYEKMSFKLTDWENHRTQTEYDDALIIKLFAFQFVNSYASLYYIAFFRGREYQNGIFNLGKEYQDSCGTENNCMSMLSLQVLVLMFAKPLPKFLKDVILPWVKRLWRLRLKPCCAKRCGCCASKVEPSRPQSSVTQKIEDYMERERCKPELGEFTLFEYNEKVLVYGFLVLFCVALPLGPLIALAVNLADIRVDARRMLWWYRRPVAMVAQDIGRWYSILQTLNVIGVITNGFIIAYVSRWGTKYSGDPEIQLWIVLGFEHIVFLLKYLLATIIPDIPQKIRLAMKREKYQVNRILHEAQKAGFGNTNTRISENFGPNMIKPSISDDLGAVPRSSDREALIGEDLRQRKHKKKHKKHKKNKKQATGELNASNIMSDSAAYEQEGDVTDQRLSQTSAKYMQAPTISILSPSDEENTMFSGGMSQGRLDLEGPARYEEPTNQSGTQSANTSTSTPMATAEHQLNLSNKLLLPKLRVNDHDENDVTSDDSIDGDRLHAPHTFFNVDTNSDTTNHDNKHTANTPPAPRYNTRLPPLQLPPVPIQYDSQTYVNFDPPPKPISMKNNGLIKALHRRKLLQATNEPHMDVDHRLITHTEQFAAPKNNKNQ